MIRVAIFEDNHALRQNLALYIGLDEGIEVVGQFPDVRKVETQVQSADPDVILMDIDMPGGNGIEGIERLRAAGCTAQVMMLTVFEDEDSIFNALKAGANGYLLKRTPPEEIVEAIKDLNSGGAPMTGTIARKVLGHFRPTPLATKAVLTVLSDRETEILELLTSGKSYKMIAGITGISVHTVRNHIHKIYDKLHVSSATEAAFKISRHK